ncbi:MAG: hypothetical protein R3B96_17505 [Pirellulaceae bacterium]
MRDGHDRQASVATGAGTHVFDFELEQSLATANKTFTNRPLAGGVVGFPT